MRVLRRPKLLVLFATSACVSMSRQEYTTHKTQTGTKKNKKKKKRGLVPLCVVGLREILFTNPIRGNKWRFAMEISQSINTVSLGRGQP